MKCISVWAVAMALAVVGCRSTASLDRSEPSYKSSRKGRTSLARSGARGGESVDPAFDLIFKRKKQEHRGSIFSEEENRRLRGGESADEAALRAIRGEKLRENKAQKDWVFGTKDGKYF